MESKISGIRNIELRHTGGSKHLLAGLPYRSLLKWLVRQPARADTLGKPFEDHAHVPVNGLCNHDYAALLGSAKLFLELRQHFLPTHEPILTGASTASRDHRVGNAIGIVQRLQGRLRPGGTLAAVEGIVGIAFNLACATALDPHDYAAAITGILANAGIPRIETRHRIFRYFHRTLNVEFTIRRTAAREGHSTHAQA